MAKIKLEIDSNAKTVSSEFKAFGKELTEEEQKLIKLQKAFQEKGVDQFLEKQKKLQIGLQFVKGETVALTTNKRNLENEIIKLINRGLTPESQAVVRLRGELDKANEKISRNTKLKMTNREATAKLTSSIQSFGMASVFAIGAITAGTLKIAQNGDEIAKTAKNLGISVESLQEFRYVAELQGTTTEALTTHLFKLNQVVGETQLGIGSLTAKYKDSHPELLAVIKNSKTTEEAFINLMPIIQGYGNRMEQAQISADLFGRAGGKLLNIMDLQADDFQKLREESRQYGQITTEEAKRMEDYTDTITNLKKSMTGLLMTMTGELIPVLDDIAKYITGLVTNNDDLTKSVDGSAKAIVVIVGALGSLMITAKITTAIITMTDAVKALRAVMIGTTATISALVVAIASVGYLIYQIQDKWTGLGIRIKQTTEHIGNAVILLRDYLLGISNYIGTVISGKIKQFLLIAEKAYYKGKVLVAQAGNLIGLYSDETVETYKDQLRAINKEYDDLTESINNANNNSMKKTLEDIGIAGKQFESNFEEINDNAMLKFSEWYDKLDMLSAKEEIASNKVVVSQKKIQTELKNTASIAQAISLGGVASLGSYEMAQEQTAPEAPIIGVSEILAKYQMILTESNKIETEYRKNQTITLQEYADQKFEIESQMMELKKEKYFEIAEAETEKQKQEDEKKRESAKKLEWNKAQYTQWGFSIASNILSDLSDLNATFEKDRVKAAKQQKAIAIVQAAINTAQAVINAFATMPWPASIAAAAIAATTGAVQTAVIARQEIPSAETGGRFEVPSNAKPDSVGLKVNPGEIVEVTPRSQEGSRQTNIEIKINEESIFRVIQRGFNNGNLYVNSNNIR